MRSQSNFCESKLQRTEISAVKTEKRQKEKACSIETIRILHHKKGDEEREREQYSNVIVFFNA